jgi:hypothetical protein
MDRNAVELFASKPPGRAWKPMHGELRNVFGPHLRCTSQFQGHSRWLVLFGAGALVNNVARIMQLKGGGRALLWDLGYWGNRLREDHDPRGPILLVGLGRKSRLYLNAPHWERDQLARLRFEFPGSRIIYRPKPDNGRNSYPVLDCETNVETGIEQLLKGAALVVCRHSNVGVDAVIAGVPVRTEDGAAAWLNDKPFTPEVRLEFLRRLAWWQWSPNEAREAWQFARRITECA